MPCQQANTHSFQGFTHGRKLQQGPPELPAELLPAVSEAIEPFAAMTPSMSAEAPMTAPGAAEQCDPEILEQQIHCSDQSTCELTKRSFMSLYE